MSSSKDHIKDWRVELEKFQQRLVEQEREASKRIDRLLILEDRSGTFSAQELQRTREQVIANFIGTDTNRLDIDGVLSDFSFTWKNLDAWHLQALASIPASEHSILWTDGMNFPEIESYRIEHDKSYDTTPSYEEELEAKTEHTLKVEPLLQVLSQLPKEHQEALARWANIAYENGVLADPDTGYDMSDEEERKLPDWALLEAIKQLNKEET